MAQYIYLLQEREFIKTNENIYKVGMTTKEHHTRFNQYPKGSILLFQMICNNCKIIENQVIKLFKQQFKIRKDIGNEYFEGEYKSMIDTIYLTIKNEKECHADINAVEVSKERCKEEYAEDEENDTDEDTEDDDTEDDDTEEDVEDPTYEITTYEEWSKYAGITVVITKKTCEGFVRFNGRVWRPFYDKNRFDFDEDYMEDLLGFIENNQQTCMVRKMIKPNELLVSWIEMMDLIYNYAHSTTHEIIAYSKYYKLNEIEQQNYIKLSKEDEYKFICVTYNVNEILKDTLKKCYTKKYDVYNLSYSEYAVNSYGVYSDCDVIFNGLTCTFTPVDELISDKILTKTGGRMICTKSTINIDVVDDILNSLIAPEIKLQYKKLMYNLLVKQEEKQIIFYDYTDDYYGCLLTTWMRDLLYSISGQNVLYVYSNDYYENKIEFKQLLKRCNPRCVIITIRGSHSKNVSVKTQINDFCKLGFKYIIVTQCQCKNTIYNLPNFRKYLNDNKDSLMKCIEVENKPIQSSWANEISCDDSIFYSMNLLLTNFLKWCCTK